MATITPNVAPGSYLEAQNITFTFGPEVTGVAVTQDTAPPSISKYISYDTLTPPNPFIAVTEDGRGRVVYDGGFPKFYNGANPDAYTTFASLTSAGKYLYNALNWVANPAKVSAGNKKVLVLGDSKIGGNYAIKSASGSGFNDSLKKICAVAGYTPTFMDVDDFDGVNLNPALALLEQYSCVLFFSTQWTDIALITPQAINDLVTYRENGNGIVFITDHGYNLTKIEDVNQQYGAFFKTGNAVVSRFGAYFTGVYDRTPVNVGFLRSNYGDHPLYAGLTNADSMPAGDSESRVVVTQTEIKAPGTLAPLTVSKSGLNAINLLLTLSDGSVQTARYVYNIQGEEFVFVKSAPVDGSGAPEETNSGKVYAGPAGRLSFNANIVPGNLGTVWGEILKNGKRIGEIFTQGTESVTQLYGEPQVMQGDTIEMAIRTPFTYVKSSVATRAKVIVKPNAVVFAASSREFRDVQGLNAAGFVRKDAAAKAIFDFINSYRQPVIRTALPVQFAEIGKMMRDFSNNRLQLRTLFAPIYQTTAAAQAALATTPANPGTYLIDAQTNTVYAYKSGSLQAIPGLIAQDFLNAPRTVTSTVDNVKYILGLDGKITALP
jgi:hypothetical protein